MYSRRIDDQTFTFEPSGGLLNAALVMMDRETDSHWSLFEHRAIYGPAEGKGLRELPGAVKVPWGEWRKAHPSTRVLSVEGKEHDETDRYERYFSSEEGFRGLSTGDDRLADKALIYTFEHAGKPHAVPFASFEGGGIFQVGERELFLYREAGDSHYRSTTAYLAPEGARFMKALDGWRLVTREERRILARWSETSRTFEVPYEEAGPNPQPFPGMDTYWYSWSLTHPDTVVLPP